MKQLSLIGLLFLINFCFSQTKQQLINSIIKVNSVHSDCVGIACEKSIQYQNFQKLKNLLSEAELIELTENENPVIRTYVSIEAINTNKADIQKIFLNELNCNQYVETFEGCQIDNEPISSIIYHKYWNKIRVNASDGITNENEREIAIAKALKSDVIMKKLDSLVIYSDKDTYWLLYSRCFQNREFEESYLNRIETLALQKNNFYAFEYLKKNHSAIYSDKLNYYLENQFPKTIFKTENEIFYFHSFIELLLEQRNKKYNQIVINKLNKDKNWKNHSSWFLNTLDKYHISL